MAGGLHRRNSLGLFPCTESPRRRAAQLRLYGPAPGARALPISRVGADPYGRAILEAMRDKRLDASCVQVDPVDPTGIVRVTVSAQGEPAYEIVENAAYDFLAWQENGRVARAARRSASARWPSAIPPAAPASCACSTRRPKR